MALYDDLIKAEPSLVETNAFDKELVVLRDDSDGMGAYIETWNYSQSIPEGFTLGKPGGN